MVLQTGHRPALDGKTLNRIKERSKRKKEDDCGSGLRGLQFSKDLDQQSSREQRKGCQRLLEVPRKAGDGRDP